MSKNTANFDTQTEMDAEQEEFIEVKKKSRKRKEESSDSSDSETIRRTTRQKRKPVIRSSSEDVEETFSPQGRKSRGLLATAKQLLAFLDEVRGPEDLKTAKGLAAQICTLALDAEKVTTTLKLEARAAKTTNERIDAMDTTLNSVVRAIKELSKAQKPQPLSSYAEKLKSNVVPSWEEAKNMKRHVITIFPQENSAIADSNETKQTIISNVAPSKEKLKIINVRKINNKGVLIETKTEEDLKRVLENAKLKAAGLKAGLPAKIKPRILIKNVPSNMEEKEIASAVRHQNLEQYPKDKLQEHFKLSFKTGPKDRETVNWVAEVSPEARKKIMKESRIYIGWHACNVQDFLAVTRCYKCQSFGHIAKHCKATVDTCGHCTENGHHQKSCSNAKENPSCVNCKRAGKPHNHSSRSRDCPAYLLAVKTHISKIDYGQDQ